MVNKITKVNAINSKLIFPKEKIKTKIKDRIILGKKLLKISITGKDGDNPFIYEVIYDKKEQSEFLSSYKKWDNFNNELLKQLFNNKENEYKKEYTKSVFLNSTGLSDVISDKKKTIQEKINFLESFIERLELIPSAINETFKDNELLNILSTKEVFIVHGHNDLIKQKTARTITKLGLEPIILHEKADGGKTIIEKFEKNSSNIGFAIILLTNDDEGKSKSSNSLKPRARQNVIFEMGYFIGKLGRERVFLLLENGVEKPGDLDGIVYTPIDEYDGWKLKLVKELKTCGYSVSADNL